MMEEKELTGLSLRFFFRTDILSGQDSLVGPSSFLKKEQFRSRSLYFYTR